MPVDIVMIDEFDHFDIRLACRPGVNFFGIALMLFYDRRNHDEFFVGQFLGQIEQYFGPFPWFETPDPEHAVFNAPVILVYLKSVFDFIDLMAHFRGQMVALIAVLYYQKSRKLQQYRVQKVFSVVSLKTAAGFPVVGEHEDEFNFKKIAVYGQK